MTWLTAFLPLASSPGHEEELNGSAGGYGFTARIPLKTMTPALYVLRVEATSQIGDRFSTAREIVFRVVPAPAR